MTIRSARAMAPVAAPIRDLLTSFNPAVDFLALSSDDGRIKVWDIVHGHLQTEFADIPAVEADALPGVKRGHLALDYTCMKWVQLSNKNKRKAGNSLLVLGIRSGDVLALDVAVGQWKWRVSCRFEAGAEAAAEVAVLMRMLQVLRLCSGLAGYAGRLLELHWFCGL